MKHYFFCLIVSLTPALAFSAELVCDKPVLIRGQPGAAGNGLAHSADPGCDVRDLRFAGKWIRDQRERWQQQAGRKESQLFGLLEKYDFEHLETEVKKLLENPLRTGSDAVLRSVALGFDLILKATADDAASIEQARQRLFAWIPGFDPHRERWRNWLPARWKQHAPNMDSEPRSSLWINGRYLPSHWSRDVSGVVLRHAPNPDRNASTGLLLYKALPLQRIMALLASWQDPDVRVLWVDKQGHCSGAWTGVCEALRIVKVVAVPVTAPAPALSPVPKPVTATVKPENTATVDITATNATQPTVASLLPKAFSSQTGAQNFIPQKQFADPVSLPLNPALPSRSSRSERHLLWPWLTGGSVLTVGVVSTVLYFFLPRPTGIEVHW